MRDKNIYQNARFHVVNVRNDPEHKNPPEYSVRLVYGYDCGSMFGVFGEVRLCVYRDGDGWICVDPETGMALSRGFWQYRQQAVDDARKRLSKMAPEKYGRIRYAAKRAWVEKGLMVRKGFGEYKWQQPEI